MGYMRHLVLTLRAVLQLLYVYILYHYIYAILCIYYYIIRLLDYCVIIYKSAAYSRALFVPDRCGVAMVYPQGTHAVDVSGLTDCL